LETLDEVPPVVEELLSLSSRAASMSACAAVGCDDGVDDAALEVGVGVGVELPADVPDGVGVGVDVLATSELTALEVWLTVPIDVVLGVEVLPDAVLLGTADNQSTVMLAPSIVADLLPATTVLVLDEVVLTTGSNNV
jgi:hypothetical protein